MTLEELIENIKGSINIVNIAKQNFNVTSKGLKHLMKNPFITEESPSIVLNEETQLYYSFNTGVGGDIIDFVMIFMNKNFFEAIMFLVEFNEMPISKDEVIKLLSENNNSTEIILRINKDAAIYFYYILRKNTGKVGMNYFTQKRKFTNDIIHQFGLGFAPNSWNSLITYLQKKGYTEEQIKNSGLITTNSSNKIMDKFRNRIIIPILDINGKVIAFGGRVLDDSKPKYLNSPDTIAFDKSKNLYAMNIAKNSKRMGFIACEGYMDVISMHQAGFDNAIASLGTAFTDSHVKLIKSLRNTVYLAYDSDDAGVDATIKAIQKLNNYDINSFVISMSPYKDPDEFIKALGADEYQKRIDTAISGKEFLIQKMSEKMRVSEEKESIQRQLALFLASDFSKKD